jgi:hypothetical protein
VVKLRENVLDLEENLRVQGGVTGLMTMVLMP